jgi:hypothetical protein
MTALQILILLGIVAGGSFLSFWARRFDMSGFEIWLPISILLAYAVSPMAGVIVAVSILIISWALFPYQLHYIVIMAACLGGTLYTVRFFPLAEATFLQTALLLTFIYNAVSNFIMFFTGGNVFSIVKFFMLSMLMSWLIYSKIGWEFIMFF